MPISNEKPIEKPANPNEIILNALKIHYGFTCVRIVGEFVMGERKRPADGNSPAKMKCGRLDDYAVENLDSETGVIKVTYRGNYVETMKI